MSLQETPNGERFQIVLLGKRNAGKSSVLNALIGQSLAVVSDVPGTTTDPVSKAMEILPIGPCMITDTPGLDDEGELGKQRVQKTVQTLHRANLVFLILDSSRLTEEELETKRGMSALETELAEQLEKQQIPYLILLNQTDRIERREAKRYQQILGKKNRAGAVLSISAEKKEGLEELKKALVQTVAIKEKEKCLVGDLVSKGELVILVVPIDSAAPKGRLILPQQQVIRDLLDHHAMAVVAQPEELPKLLERFSGQVSLVITDSQAFSEVAGLVPEEIFLTSFSILFARYKGELEPFLKGVEAVKKLQNGDRVLMAEGCTHHRQCEDIGTVKIPRLLRNYTGKELIFETISGTGFPEDLSRYAMMVHCGGCTLPEKEMKFRLQKAEDARLPVVNYGILLAFFSGILERSCAIFQH